MRKQLAAILGFAIFLSGCVMGPNYKKPDLSLPQGAQDDYSAFTSEKWWDMFEDPALNALEEEALANNKDLIAAMAKVEEARSKLGEANANLMPTLDATGYAQRTGFAKHRGVPSYNAGLTAAYQLDFWGQYRRLSEAARAELLSTAAQKDTVRLALTADVANYYFNYITLKEQVEIARRTLESRTESVRIYQVRYDNGYSTELDLKRVEAEQASVQATLAEFERQFSSAGAALKMLLGRSPKDIIESTVDATDLQAVKVLPQVPEGIPAELLQRRPDVRAAEGVLMAANANVGAAKAAYFPAIVLTASGGYASDQLNTLVSPSTSFWNIGAGLYMPVFQGGKVRSKHKQAKAVYKQMLASYEKAAQNAYRDTFDALNNNNFYRKIFEANKAQALALARSLELAQKQKDEGLIDMLDLLDVERNLLNAETNLAAARRNQLSALVSLAQALGGGWHE